MNNNLKNSKQKKIIIIFFYFFILIVLFCLILYMIKRSQNELQKPVEINNQQINNNKKTFYWSNGQVWYINEYNKNGQKIKTTYYNPDGSIKK